jgi:hypothetical protein
MRDRRVVQLAVILQNGIDVQPGDIFPVGWDSNRDRILAEATPAMIARARNLRRIGGSRRPLSSEGPSAWSQAS